MEKIKYRYIFSLLFLLIPATVLFNSCTKEEEDDPQDEQRIAENTEFYKLLGEWYYWYDKIPNINPANYASVYDVMEAVRHRPLDRWSYVTTRKEFESYYLESKFIGYGFGSAFDAHGNLRVTFIFNSVDMYEKGVRRSWILREVNGTTLRPGVNINQLLGANEVGISNDFLFIDHDGEPVAMTLVKDEVFMNTVLHKEVIEYGGKKAGYLVFKNFTTPSFDELDEAVNYFNSEGIDELILDLRYNGGGQTNVANYLASIIGGQKVAGKHFAKYLYNDKKEDENFTDNFKDEEIPFNVDRLITISTRATASASEMVINGLKPFMDVYIVGDNTYRKPMGMNAWYYGDLYAFVPVTFKIANADSDGDYFDGLVADSYTADDITRPFGDPEEASLKEALEFMATGTFSGLPRKKSLYVQPFEEMTGIRAEIGAH